MPLTRTTTFEDVRNQWATLCGLDSTSIISDDDTAFIELMNASYPKAWVLAEFPFGCQVTGFLTVSRTNAVDLSSNSSVRDVLSVTDANPYYKVNAKKLRYSINQDNIYVPEAADPTELSVSGLVSSGTTATATTSTAHGYAVNDTVVIAGAGESDYNGTFEVVTVPSTTTFTYTMGADPVDTATGTITSTRATVFLYYRTQETEFDGTLATTLPYALKNYLAYQISADWLASEGQEDKSLRRQAKADEHAQILMDNYERQQQQILPNQVEVRTVGVR